MLETDDFLHLELDIAVDHIIREHIAAGEEATIFVEIFKRFAQGAHTVGIFFSSFSGRW